MQLEKVLEHLRQVAAENNKEGMARFGIDNSKALGVSMPNIRKLGKEVGKNHRLALELWSTGIHEARILASVVEDPEQITQSQMDNWVKDFNSWDLCDQVCGNLFDRTRWRFEKAVEYSFREAEYEKRAGFALMAWIAVHDKKAADSGFEPFLKRIEAESCDDRNFVKKAVNWALRQIGKKNRNLHSEAMRVSRRIEKLNCRSAQWIAKDAIRELENPKTINRLTPR